MTQEFKDLEVRLDEEYTIACNELINKRQAELDEKWPRMTAEDKAEVDYGARFLQEEFPAGKDTNKVITVKLRTTSLFSDTARRLGLQTEMLKLPRGHAEIDGEFDILVVVAPSSAKFKDNDKWRTINGELKRARDDANFEARQRMFAATGKGLNWIVTGKYKITCPVIEKGWKPREDLALEIFTEETAKGPQMFAKFDFSIIEGIMRFERHPEIGKSKSASKKATSKKRKREESSEEEEDKDEDEYDDYDDYDRRSPTPEEFYLGALKMPSQKHSTWIYRWRGSETGEGEIQLGSEAKKYEITFCEPRGTKIKGTFESEYQTDCEFTGVKFAPGRPGSVDISREWADNNSAAYERAREGRWY